MASKTASKLAIGTVQFGLDYGINNLRGKIPVEEIKPLLDFAYNNGIDTLDTSSAYGESERVIGDYLSNSTNHFQIISKFLAGKPDNFDKSINNTLSNLKSNNIYGYLFHSFSDFKNDHKLYDNLLKYKELGKIAKIGFSLYFTDDLEMLFDKNIAFDLIQCPYNIFDRRFENYFHILKQKNIEIHCRSIFLQGLLFKNPAELHPFFYKVKQKIEELNNLSGSLNISLSSLCLNFGFLNPYIDKIVIGVDSMENLKENICAVDDGEKINSVSIFDNFIEDDENILLPFKWKLN